MRPTAMGTFPFGAPDDDALYVEQSQQWLEDRADFVLGVVVVAFIILIAFVICAAVAAS